MGEKEDKAEAEKKAAEEKAAAEKKAEEEAKKKTDESNKSNSLIDQAKAEREKGEALLEAQKKENDRTEQLQADAIVAGKGISQDQSPPKDTDEEYAEKFLKGEVDPLADDGFK